MRPPTHPYARTHGRTDRKHNAAAATGINMWPDVQNILRQSHDYLTTMPKLRSTYDGRLIYKTA